MKDRSLRLNQRLSLVYYMYPKRPEPHLLAVTGAGGEPARRGAEPGGGGERRLPLEMQMHGGGELLSPPLDPSLIQSN